jgi:hypothetical protein
MATLIIILLILLPLGVFPVGNNFGWGAGGGLGTILVILLILFLCGVI